MPNDLSDIILKLDELKTRAAELNKDGDKLQGLIAETKASIEAAKEHIEAAEKRLRKHRGE